MAHSKSKSVVVITFHVTKTNQSRMVYRKCCGEGVFEISVSSLSKKIRKESRKLNSNSSTIEIIIG
jgi:hypothetical protein